MVTCLFIVMITFQVLMILKADAPYLPMKVAAIFIVPMIIVVWILWFVLAFLCSSIWKSPKR